MLVGSGVVLRSEAGSQSRESEDARGKRGEKGEGRVCECECVYDARGLRASRLNDAETGRGDADCDGHSWLHWHGWGIRNGTQAERGRKTGLYCIFEIPPVAEVRRGGYIQVCY